jgi:hypothetical protein
MSCFAALLYMLYIYILGPAVAFTHFDFEYSQPRRYQVLVLQAGFRAP